jgi:hypothetical protein
MQKMAKHIFECNPYSMEKEKKNDFYEIINQ